MRPLQTIREVIYSNNRPDDAALHQTVIKNHFYSEKAVWVFVCVCVGLNTLKENLSAASRGVSVGLSLQDSLCAQKAHSISVCVERACVCFVGCVCCATGFPDLKMLEAVVATPTEQFPSTHPRSLRRIKVLMLDWSLQVCVSSLCVRRVCISGYFERAVAIGPYKTLLYLHSAYQVAKNSSPRKWIMKDCALLQTYTSSWFFIQWLHCLSSNNLIWLFSEFQ